MQFGRMVGAATLAVVLLLGLVGPSFGQMTVFLNFDSDWETNVSDAAVSAGVTVFSPTEVGQIETSIENDLNSIFADTLITFTTTVPGGDFTVIDFGAGGSGALGSAPLDYFNAFVNQTANMFVDNFDFIIDEFSGSTNRSTQIDQFATAIAGTAAHELGHTIGMHHHHAYSATAITPANYGATGGAQNDHIIATGSTSLGETGRETVRSLSPWARFMIQAAGGLDSGLHGVTGTALHDTVLFETDHFNGADVGDTTGTARALGAGTDLEYSGFNQSFHAFSELDNSSDVDIFSIDVIGPGTLMAEVVHNSRWGSSLNPVIELIDIDGTTILATNADAAYSGNTYGSGGFGVDDSFLVNVELDEAGTYFLRVTSEGGSGVYSLLIGASTSPIPEPTSAAILVGLALVGCGIRRRRR